MKRFVLVVFALTAGLVGAAALAASAVGVVPRGSGTVNIGVFRAFCAFTHRNQDDAIVFPNQPGRSHDHSYFGSPHAHAYATAESMRVVGDTSCNIAGDTAAYWVPTLFADGRAVEPRASIIEYVKGTFARVRPFPPDFKIIAGNAQAQAPQNRAVTWWTCATPPPVPEGIPRGRFAASEIPTCARDQELVLQVNFPNCWDGVRLDSDDHKSHMTYAVSRVCPASHPVAVPELRMIVRYPSVAGDAELASGGEYSAHADFVNSWDQSELERWVRIYLKPRGR
jgi:hypothetical protein